MNEYRKETDAVFREARWTFFRGLPLFMVAIIILSAIGFGLRSLGLFGSTVVKRKVFEHSYQRSEGLKARIATDEAVLAEIERKLTNPNLDSNTRANLEAQASAARIRIATARRMQK